jgi:uncharacterized protein with ParB-like and HNH nuclease domain
MKKIEDIFQANGASILEVFRASGGAVGFKIPTYQRRYSWDEANIDRLFDDINEGLKSLAIDTESLTFIGTIILNEDKIPDFDGLPLSVVDGQQRLTTLILATVVLYNELSNLSDEFANNSHEIVRHLVDNTVKSLKNYLMLCFAGRYDPISTQISDFYPRLLREESDVWSYKRGAYEYSSPVSKYIFEYLKFILKLTTSANAEAGIVGAGADLFKRNLNRIKENLNSADEKYYGSDESMFSNLSELLLNSKYRSTLLPDLEFSETQLSSVISSLGEKKDRFLKLIYLISFSSFFLNRVAVTKVIASDEKYAFEIFEALNTTGEPLTALETFKPIVSHYEDIELSTQGGFARSESKLVFDALDEYLEKYVGSKKKQDESKALVVSLALYHEGKKEGLHLSSQRKYLRESYERVNSLELKQEYVKGVGALLDFKSRFWQEGVIENQFKGEQDKDTALFCLTFIRDMKTTLTIPILLRYYEEYNSSGNFSEFLEAIKAITAFLALWRGYHGGTNQIDNVFREVMSKGSKYVPDAVALKKGLKNQNRLPSPIKLKEYLKSYLQGRNALEKDRWVAGVSIQPLYRSSKVLCRFLLFMASSNTYIANDGRTLVKGRGGAFKDYLNLDSWNNKNFSTIEHVAPQTRGQSDWPDDIYTEAYMVDSIGNLSLLPERENSMVGNGSWTYKKLYYAAFSAKTTDELGQAIVDAESTGKIKFKKKTKEALERGDCQVIMQPISECENWNAAVIKDRGRNIATLCWDELNSWLK